MGTLLASFATVVKTPSLLAGVTLLISDKQKSQQPFVFGLIIFVIFEITKLVLSRGLTLDLEITVLKQKNSGKHGTSQLP